MQSAKLNKLRTVLAVLLLAFAIFSSTLAAAETNHESFCTEDNCPVCFVIQVIKANLGGLILFFTVSGVIHHFAESGKLAYSCANKFYISYTLFSLKTRLND